MKRYLIPVIFLLASLAGMALTGCQPAAVPAQFEVSKLTIKPSEMFIGETATVTAVVTNNGGSSGLYNASLKIDTVNSDARSVGLAPGEQKTITFSLKMQTAGKYSIEIGDASAAITIKEKLVPKAAEIKYDGGLPQDYLGLDKPCTGYLVSFTPPSEQFVIEDVRIMGLVYGAKGTLIKDLEIQIWDKNNKVLHSTTIPANKFPQVSFLLSDIQNKGDWVDVYVPEIKVDGNFFVHIYTGSTTGQGFRMGVDNSIRNTHSDITIRDANGVDIPAATWPYSASKWFGDKGWVNWLVRVSGNAMVPER